MKMVWIPWFLLLGGAGLLAAPIDPDNPPQGRFNDDWAEIFIGGAKSGYAHSTMSREGNKIHTSTTMKLKIDRAGQTVALGVVQETTESVDGLPLEFSSVMDLSVMKMVTQGSVKDGRVRLVSSQYGMEQKQEFDYPLGAVMAWGAHRESLKRGFKPGTEYTLPMYAPELRMDGAVSGRTRVGDWETFTHRGKVLRGQRVNVTMESPVGAMEMISWVDESGDPLKARVPMPGLAEMEIITTDQVTALSEFVPPEIFMTTVVKARRTIDRETAGRIRFRVSQKSDQGKLEEIPETGMQKLVSRSERAAELTVTRQVHKPLTGRAPLKPSSDLDECLSSNLLINKDDPVLIELAKRASGGETEPFALGDKLRRFVTDFVSAKSMNVGFGSASEVARTKEGDCSEHAILLTALGRLAGLPSRVVVGLAYAPFFGGKDDIFGYHMWSQFWIDGHWYDFDAALRETECNPGRIAFATSSLKDAGLADLSLAILGTIGAIDIEILEIEPASALQP